MTPVAKKRILWSIGLFVVGAVLMVYVPDIYVAVSDRAGPNADIGLGLLDVFMTLVRWTLMPVGASLVGAAVVIQTLSTRHDRD